jgi:alkylation response protein AidB-like acyl-CoA dehydrogenase
MYRLNEAQQKIVRAAAQVADQSVSPLAALVDRERAFPEDSIVALGKAGLLGLTIPATCGGMGEGLRTAAAVLDEVAQRCSSTAIVYLMHICGVACYAAAPDRTAAPLRDAARGKHLGTLAFSERGSRSHFWAPVSRAEASNGGSRLNAQKSFVTSAGHADGYVVSTLAANATTPVESTIYLVLRSGGGAFAGAHGIERMYRDARAPIVMAPTTDQAHDFIGRALCGMEVF